MADLFENKIARAIQDVEDGWSQRKAASRNGISRSTLGNRLNGMESRQKSHAYRQKLSEAQEKSLRDWILAQEALGFPPTHA